MNFDTITQFPGGPISVMGSWGPGTERTAKREPVRRDPKAILRWSLYLANALIYGYLFGLVVFR